MNNISFPNIGIEIPNVPTGFTLFGVEVKLYAICITLGMLGAYLIANRVAKKTGQNPENYLDYLLIGVIPALLCARLYYVLFSLDYYFSPELSFDESMLRVVNIREGGLAIYGGLIGGTIVAIIFAKKRKLNLFEMLDTIFIGVPLAQALGRLGNFFNREAFGSYTDSFFAMGIPVEYYRSNGTLYGLTIAGVIDDTMLGHQVNNCITVHPTFLYEALWNIALFVILLLLIKKKRFHGEMFAIYLFGYGLGRFWIEGLRTDPLMIGQTNLRVSQVLALVLVVGSIVYMVIRLVQTAKNGEMRMCWVAADTKKPTKKKESE